MHQLTCATPKKSCSPSCYSHQGGCWIYGHYTIRVGRSMSGRTWNNAAARYDSSIIGAFYVNWMEERIYRIETDEGFDLLTCSMNSPCLS